MNIYIEQNLRNLVSQCNINHPEIDNIVNFLSAGSKNTLIIPGFHNTYKTQILLQTINALPEDKIAQAAFISIKTYQLNFLNLEKEIESLYNNGIKYFFIDNVTEILEFVNYARIFTDIFFAHILY